MVKKKNIRLRRGNEGKIDLKGGKWYGQSKKIISRRCSQE